MEFKNHWILFIVVIFYYLFAVVQSIDEMSHHIRKCCNSGLKHGRSFKACEKYEYDVSTIQPLWRGLCYSTFNLCCSQEVNEQNCVAGRLAAENGLRCHENSNVTNYSNCCRACQVGLAVKASEHNCNDELFSYFKKSESYRLCCSSNNLSSSNGDIIFENVNEKNDQNYDTNFNKISKANDLQKNNRSYSGEDDDGTIVLYDDDICGKVNNLCAQICENTKEAYLCKCNLGYKLDNNNVTCTKLEDDDTDDINAEDNEDFGSIDDDGTCPLGYERELKSDKCIDVNECASNKEVCDVNQYCHNTIGSYRCLNIKSKHKIYFSDNTKCKDGFIFNDKTQFCEDYNECLNNPCEINYNCINYNGSYECRKLNSSAGLTTIIEGSHLNSKLMSNQNYNKCGEGFQFKNDICLDIDECINNERVCDSTQICTNDIGGYHCDCKIGYNLDIITNTCVDINECSINNHNCLPSQRCDNTIGSYVCTRLKSCGTGYTLNAETGNCDDDDECAANTHNCTPEYKCFNTKGSFRCYRPSTPKTTTSTTTTTTTKPTIITTIMSTASPKQSHYANKSLISEKLSHQTLSHNHVRNYLPNYSVNIATISCDAGFYRNQLGACVDLNECIYNNPCGSHQRCINTNGSYRCRNLLQCAAGYRSMSDGSMCIDVDECETGEHNCIENQICHNRNGGYVCSCPFGHEFLQNRCVDIDECKQGNPAVCPSNAECMNTIGSFYCECKSGFQKSRDNDRFCLDVDECQEIPGLCQQKCVNFWGGYRCSCNDGFELSMDNRTCNDVDECEVHKSYKLCMGLCNNVPGSYECSCPRGYTLGMDKNTCRDIDECATGEFCTGRHDICTNIRGSFKCTTIHCPYGYINDPDQKNRCRQTSNSCEGDDCYKKPSAYTYNFITLVSQLIIPPEGRVIFSLRGPSWYDDIDFDLKIVKIQAAPNIEKAADHHFETVKKKHEVHLKMKRSLEGPQDIELELSMTVFMNGLPRGKTVAKIFILVSQYTF